MSDGTELPQPVEFDLSPVISFNAKDVIASLKPLQIVELIKQLDEEMNEWEATILLSSYFGNQMAGAPGEFVAMSDEQLVESLKQLEADGQEPL